MGSITFSGLGSGMDTGSIISQLVGLERISIQQMQTKQNNYRSQLSIVQSINSKLQSLQSKATSYDKLSNFLAFSTASSDTDYATATAKGTASPGSYSVEVKRLASAQRTYSKEFDSKTTAGVAGSGELQIKIAGEDDPYKITIAATDTLEGIAAKINAQDGPFSASVLATNGKFRLQVNGLETGDDGGMTFTEPVGLDLALTTNVSTAQDAWIKVDGFDVYSEGNEVSTAIDGVTLNLKKLTATDTPITIQVSTDNTTVKNRISEMVAAFNAVTGQLYTENQYSGSAKGQDRLVGDSTLRSLQSQLGALVSRELEGLTGSYSSLAEIGIKTAKGGQISIDSTKLDAALSKDPVGVAQVFTGLGNGGAEGIAAKIDALVDGYIDFTNGSFTAKTKGINTAISSINKTIASEESRITKYEERLRSQFTAMEMMVNSLNSQSSFMSSNKGLW